MPAITAHSAAELALRTLTPDILNGKLDPSTLPRYGNLMSEMAADVESPRIAHEAAIAAQHRRWLTANPLTPPNIKK